MPRTRVCLRKHDAGLLKAGSGPWDLGRNKEGSRTLGSQKRRERKLLRNTLLSGSSPYANSTLRQFSIRGEERIPVLVLHRIRLVPGKSCLKKHIPRGSVLQVKLVHLEVFPGGVFLGQDHGDIRGHLNFRWSESHLGRISGCRDRGRLQGRKARHHHHYRQKHQKKSFHLVLLAPTVSVRKLFAV